MQAYSSRRVRAAWIAKKRISSGGRDTLITVKHRGSSTRPGPACADTSQWNLKVRAAWIANAYLQRRPRHLFALDGRGVPRTLITTQHGMQDIAHTWSTGPGSLDREKAYLQRRPRHLPVPKRQGNSTHPVKRLNTRHRLYAPVIVAGSHVCC